MAGGRTYARAGLHDREIVIQQVTLSDNTFTTKGEESWSNFASAWAFVTPMEASERFTSQQKFSSRVSTFEIRYVSGVTAKMRISYESTYWRILGIKEIGRRRGLEILAELIE